MKATFKPRLKVLKNGNAVLSGIPYQVMDSILTNASLSVYDGLNAERTRQDSESNAPLSKWGSYEAREYKRWINKEYYESMRWAIDNAKKHLDNKRMAKYEKQLSLTEKLRHSTRMSKLINDIWRAEVQRRLKTEDQQP